MQDLDGVWGLRAVGGGTKSNEPNPPHKTGTKSPRFNFKTRRAGAEEVVSSFSFFFFFFFTRKDTACSRTSPPSPPPGQKKSRRCTEKCISCVCSSGACSRTPPGPLTPPGSCPCTLGGRPSPGFGTRRSPAVCGRHLGSVPLGRPPLVCVWRGRREGGRGRE